MEKLIFTHCWGDEAASGTNYIPFEYKSKDEFVFDMLEKYKNYKWEYFGKSKPQSDYDTSFIEMFPNVWLNKGELEDIENNITTLEEWFQRNKKVYEK